MSDGKVTVHEWALRSLHDSRFAAVNGIRDALEQIEKMDDEDDRQAVINAAMTLLERALKRSEDLHQSMLLRLMSLGAQ